MDHTLLKESLQRVLAQKESFAATFYQCLQENHPHLRPFFANVDMPRQQSSLVATLIVLVEGDERGEDLTPAFRKIGRLHNERHIRPEHYPAFGNTLMETLAQFDPEWAPAHKEAWSTALDQCVRGMMASYEAGATLYKV